MDGANDTTWCLVRYNGGTKTDGTSSVDLGRYWRHPHDQRPSAPAPLKDAVVRASSSYDRQKTIHLHIKSNTGFGWHLSLDKYYQNIIDRLAILT